LSAVEQARPQIAHYVERMSARRSQQGLRAPYCVLNVNIVAKHLGRLDALAERITARRLAAALSVSASIAWRAIPSAVPGPFAMNMNGKA
jgi:hypothetical protein